MAQRKFIIDCDPGTDDAQAIMMALAQPDVQVLAITVVQGNTGVDQAAQNAMKVLKICDRMEIPVYKGNDVNLVNQNPVVSEYHGLDGLGDSLPSDRFVQQITPEHAVTALTRLVSDNPGEITLVTLGPLSNVALAIRMDSTFGSKLKECHTMGGNCYGRGNVTASGEFNFVSDPEAAFVVLNELQCPITLSTNEICTQQFLPKIWHENLLAMNTAKTQFIQKADLVKLKNWAMAATRGGMDQTSYLVYDQMTMAIALNSKVALKMNDMYVTVELQGALTRGQAVVDWNGKLNKKPNVRLLMEADINLVGDIITKAVQ